MSNNIPYGYGPQSMEAPVNRYIYVNQSSTLSSAHVPNTRSSKVLVNPHFKTSKVFVNPNFSVNSHQGSNTCRNNVIHVNPRLNNLNMPIVSNTKLINNSQPSSLTCTAVKSFKIHVNPNMTNVPISTCNSTTTSSVHVNPKFHYIISNNKCNLNKISPKISGNVKENVPFKAKVESQTVFLSRSKLIRCPVNTKPLNKKRRNSVKSKYKIVKSTKTSSKVIHKKVDISKLKIDRRRRKSLSITMKNNKKYVYTNRFTSISDLVKNSVVKKCGYSSFLNISNVVNIRGTNYKKSKNSLRRLSVSSQPVRRSPILKLKCKKTKPFMNQQVINGCGFKNILQRRKSIENIFSKRKFKIIRKQFNKDHLSDKISTKKLRTCNIPCPYFRKYGVCKGMQLGKCFRKHDPDQIALCTKFLQGACINEKCHLSHNVSTEKMPTCKYYLEGSCSKENCPYLHVKISPKAEVCRDFLEGFCKKAAECNKRHQYLCPEYEKYGKCLKQRCPYPHGKMVRHYLVNKNFAKNYSSEIESLSGKDKRTLKKEILNVKQDKSNLDQNKEKPRYYVENQLDEKYVSRQDSANTARKTENANKPSQHLSKNTSLQFRPQLGTLPAFIPFGNL